MAVEVPLSVDSVSCAVASAAAEAASACTLAVSATAHSARHFEPIRGAGVKGHFLGSLTHGYCTWGGAVIPLTNLPVCGRKSPHERVLAPGRLRSIPRPQPVR